MVIRPATREMLYKSAEQWHWFDCPRQLGTNSPDTPRNCAVVDEVALREGDVVLAMSDGVIDNLWAHEIVEKVCESLERWRAGEGKARGVVLEAEGGLITGSGGDGMMGFVADELMEAARVIAVDPFAESPFMEHAIEEGLASGGGEFCRWWCWFSVMLTNLTQANWTISASWLRFARGTTRDEDGVPNMSEDPSLIGGDTKTETLVGACPPLLG
jgi:hypothetical protein